MAPNYPKLIAETVQVLPVPEQAEVYTFAQFVRTKSDEHRPLRRSNRKQRSVFSMFGKATAKVTDASINHDKYIYE
ncbi:MAG: hypothetical protein A2268_06810 [Candidatus Raymondbacteria bacterium RifOxyA12_full_50_37]|uniref:Uncharacterized protein n=1 Tax=Candidatus Raymondbacteria bacterium RIFOXYD12_FULL_49_13 TaxID=1817890 RepID=A0A1F7FL30_UNCRA|nr:MAG: hypothetical protein A2268_06810 [Candidatus Raymondbacteria bacterium RifOxyA12_full_50_37]OGJ88804.1 MAG: hypothetical protein A2248_08390 [Candidatus Raymondbacteria bacterium RIFOXYA2_FULL_49_16]OGJ96563.1 MAG: hypothetical protein A2453_03355 [Candidatus Raymondbacteria bacterium RIFOXYC2_FULL_50_21]OGJ99658.1 MAG: hypothetical protein A2487_17250 [Candidatus Raymondbacteria bacterium RifOxyC12_full_50_8]OGK04432.1 MAG: hypothetical protein A2350_17060 [Candidatus Raymondbacteria b